MPGRALCDLMLRLVGSPAVWCGRFSACFGGFDGFEPNLVLLLDFVRHGAADGWILEFYRALDGGFPGVVFILSILLHVPSSFSYGFYKRIRAYGVTVLGGN